MTCGYVIADTECSTGFPLREYQGNKVQVSWDAEGKNWKSSNISIAGIGRVDLNRSVNVVIIFRNSGSITAKFIQKD